MALKLDTALSVLAIVIPIVVTLAIAGTLVWLVVKYHSEAGKGLAAVIKALCTAIVAIATHLYKNYTSIVTYIKTKLLTRSAYFRYGILVCMVVSVIHGSHLFATKENITILNYLEIAVFDIGTYALVEGLISTRKKGYFVASLLILVAIVAINGISFIANLAYNVHYFDSTQFSDINIFSTTISAKDFFPFLQSTPPLIIIVMCFVAELFLQTENEEEAKTFKDRLRNRKQRQIDKLDVELDIKKQRRDLIAKYKPEEKAVQVVEKQQQALPVAWSFLGIVKGYQRVTAVQDVDTTKQITEAIQKMSVSIVHLEQHFNQINQYVLPSQPEQQYIQAGNEQPLLQQPTRVEEIYVDDITPAQQATNNSHMHMHTDTSNTPKQNTTPGDMHMHMRDTKPLQAAVHTPVAVKDSNPVTSPQMEIDATLLPLLGRYPGIASWVESPTVDINIVAQTLGVAVTDLQKVVNKPKGIQAIKLNNNIVKVTSVVEWVKRQPALVGEIR